MDGYTIMPEPYKTQNNKYAWLINNLKKSKNYGANIEDNNWYHPDGWGTYYVIGYWTETKYESSSNYAWSIDNRGYMNEDVNVDCAYKIGVKPVISISKYQIIVFYLS